MNQLFAPGLYRRPTLPTRASGPLARGDVAAFLGYAVRGPLLAPVRIETLTTFETLFGPRPRHGFLWAAVKAFFENGGQAAYVLRVADGETATAATAEVGGGWTASASFGWPMIDPRRLGRAASTGAQAWIQLIEAQIRARGERVPDPGAWGNGLEVSTTRTALALTRSIPDPTAPPRQAELMLESLAGIEAASVLELTQVSDAGGVVTRRVVPESVDPARRLLRLHEPLDAIGLDPRATIRVASVEFRIEIRLDGRVDQTFEALSPNPAHGRALAATLVREGRLLALTPPSGVSDWTRPEAWPAEGTVRLGGGADGLSSVGVGDWRRAAEALAPVTEAALIAAPDLVLPGPELGEETAELPEPPRDCTDLSRPLEGEVIGRVLVGATPVAAMVEALGPGGRTRTDAQGGFRLTGLPLELVTLRVTGGGIEPLETLVQARRTATEEILLQPRPITTPRPLDETAILELGAMLADPAVVGRYKVAILDPPASASRVDALRGWRSRLGDSSRIGLFGPWLVVAPDAAGLSAMPPSGHVCGAFAAAERADAIHRTGANRGLRFVEGVAFEIDEPAQELLNPVGINAIRVFPGRGVRINGTRTLSSDPQWRFLTTRRIVDAVAKTLERGLAWAAFEPNTVLTRQAVTVTVTSLLAQMWRAGTLSGESPEAAFRVQCDAENNDDTVLEKGRLFCDVAIAPTEPYEFVLFRLGRAEDAITVTE